MEENNLSELCKLIRYDILTATTEAGSGHPTSSLSSVELMATLFFNGYFHYDFENPSNIFNDRFILSKGHASPLLYSLYHAAGIVSYEELLTLRKFDSVLEGHPTPRLKYVDVATGSLGQGLSIGVGMALGIKLVMSSEFRVQSKNSRSQLTTHNSEPKVFVLLGDSEMSEGQIWEAMEIASYYKLNNLVAIVDVNRLGQRGETMLGWDVETYCKRAQSFGWNAIVIEDGHNLDEINKVFSKTLHSAPYSLHPTIFIAKTIKGKGVSFWENKNSWHGKPLPKDKLPEALKEIGEVDLNLHGTVAKPIIVRSSEFGVLSRGTKTYNLQSTHYNLEDKIATREAYGDALVTLGEQDRRIVVLDAELSNSTFAFKFQEKFPDRYFEMFIAEQNMISVALGLRKMGFIPYCSTFASFLTRAFDQIRMTQYSRTDLKMVGSHAGVFMGPDGPSQMGLEDFAMMRSILNSTVLSPADATAAFKLTQTMLTAPGIAYMRVMRDKLPIIYKDSEKFEVGGSKILKQSKNDTAVVFATGVTVHEALKAYEELKKENISITVVDLYSVKPVDISNIQHLTSNIHNIIVVEDHYPAGGLAEAVLSALSSKIQDLGYKIKFQHLCVKKLPHSGSPAELLAYEEIDATAIVKAVRGILAIE